MSLFRFKDSPQEIKTIVAHQVVRDCWPAEGRFYESNTVTEARVVKLRELSILNSIFTRPVQIGLFYRMTLEQGIKTTNFLLCIKSNPSLGTLVKVLDFPFGPSRGMWELGTSSELVELIGIYPNLIHLGLGCSTHSTLDGISRAKNLQALNLFGSQLDNLNNFNTFQNLTFLFLGNLNLFNDFKPLLVINFPALIELQLETVRGWSKLAALFPQIRNLSIVVENVSHYLDNTQFFGKFTGINNLEFSGTFISDLVNQALTKISSPLLAIRFSHCYGANYDWNAFQLLLADTTSTLSQLNTLSLPIRQINLTGINGMILRARLREKQIRLEGNPVTESFQDWIKNVEMIRDSENVWCVL